MDLLEAHRGDGCDGHEQRVEERPLLDELVADGADRDDPDEEDQDLLDPGRRLHDAETPTSAAASCARKSSPRSTRYRIARSPAPAAAATLGSWSSTNTQASGGSRPPAAAEPTRPRHRGWRGGCPAAGRARPRVRGPLPTPCSRSPRRSRR